MSQHTIFIRIYCAWIFFLTSSCVTTSSPTAQELEAWQREQAVIRQSISTEQSQLRQNLAQRKITSPFLWRLEKNGKVSYLLGSMHMGIAASELPFSIHQLFRKSTTHVFESNGQLDTKSKALLTQSSADNKNGPCLDQTLSPKAWQIYHHDLLPFEEFQYRCLPPSGAYDFYLNMRAIILGGEQTSLDGDLMAESRAPGFQTEYLETSAEAMDALLAVYSSPSKKIITAQELSAYLTGDRLKDVKEEIAKSYQLALAYKSGDFQQIDALTGDEMAELYPELIARRNQLWLPRLLKILERGSSFITVGAAHMTGPSSLLTLLKNEGYNVHRLALSELTL